MSKFIYRQTKWRENVKLTVSSMQELCSCTVSSADGCRSLVANPNYVSSLKVCLLITQHISENYYVSIIMFSGGPIVLDIDTSVSLHNPCVNVLVPNKPSLWRKGPSEIFQSPGGHYRRTSNVSGVRIRDIRRACKEGWSHEDSAEIVLSGPGQWSCLKPALPIPGPDSP